MNGIMAMTEQKNRIRLTYSDSARWRYYMSILQLPGIEAYVQASNVRRSSFSSPDGRGNFSYKCR